MDKTFGVYMAAVVVVLFFLQAYDHHAREKIVLSIENKQKALHTFGMHTMIYEAGSPWALVMTHTVPSEMFSLGVVEIGILTRLVKRCFECGEKSTMCDVKEGEMSLFVSNSLRLEIKDFMPCHVPQNCHWQGIDFNCLDLQKIVHAFTK